jgi:hypothetical protein
MPTINGRYYMNPQYGAALERARAADEGSIRVNGMPQPSWLDRLLGFAPHEELEHNYNRTRNDADNSPLRLLSAGKKAGAQKSQPNSHESRPPADNTTVGNSVYNETSGLRPTAPSGAGSAHDLSDARAGLAGVIKNRDAKGTAVGKGTAPGRLTKSGESAVKAYPPAKRAYEESQAAAGKVSGNPAGPQHFYFDHGQGKPPWAQGKEPKESFGPFVNEGGGGDVPKGAKVKIRIYELGDR